VTIDIPKFFPLALPVSCQRRMLASTEAEALSSRNIPIFAGLLG
jgi:hypothetical protein